MQFLYSEMLRIQHSNLTAQAGILWYSNKNKFVCSEDNILLISKVGLAIQDYTKLYNNYHPQNEIILLVIAL
jgi:hypothetical protein